MSVVLSLPWMLLQAATQSDTAVYKTIAVRSWWQSLIDIEQALVPIILIVLLIGIAIAMSKVSAAVQRVTEILKTSSADLSGAAHSVRNVAEDVRGITQAVKGNVESVGDTVSDVNERVRAAVDIAEGRLRRFDALVDVAQEELEDFVVSAASTMRGVRSGASVLRRSLSFVRRNGGLFRSRRKGWRERARKRHRELEQERRSAPPRRAGEERPRVRTHVPDA